MRRRNRQIVALFLCLLQGACFSWKPVAPTRVAPAPHGTRPVARLAHVELRDGRTLRLERVLVVGDSLVGSVTHRAAEARVAVPLTDVTYVEAKVIHPWRTAVVAAGLGVAVIAVAFGHAMAAAGD